MGEDGCKRLPASELVAVAVAVEDMDVATAEDSPSAAAALLSSSRLTWTPRDWTCPCKISFVVLKLSNCSLPWSGAEKGWVECKGRHMLKGE